MKKYYECISLILNIAVIIWIWHKDTLFSIFYLLCSVWDLPLNFFSLNQFYAYVLATCIKWGIVEILNICAPCHSWPMHSTLHPIPKENQNYNSSTRCLFYILSEYRHKARCFFNSIHGHTTLQKLLIP